MWRKNELIIVEIIENRIKYKWIVEIIRLWYRIVVNQNIRLRQITIRKIKNHRWIDLVKKKNNWIISVLIRFCQFID